MAVLAVSNIVKSSLGPQGLDKMLVDDIGDVTITNDGATILKLLEVEHPAARVLVELSQIQDREVGDGTTSVVVLAAELLKRGNQLIQNKIHPTTVITGFRNALKESVKFIQQNMVIKMDQLTDDVLKKTAITTLSSKLIGPESDHFADIITRAMLNTKSTNLDGTNKYSVKSVSILKSHGQSSMDSRLVDGYALCTMRGAQGMPMEVKNARVACLDMSLNKYRLQMGVQILVENPNDLEKIRQREMDITKERCVKLIQAGANVILCTKGIDEFAIKYFVEVGALAVRRCEKGDLRRIAKACGASVMTTLADENGEESVDPANLGVAESVSEERVGDNDYIFIRVN
jgi:T-complex protein 1 subunit alpha